MKEYTVEIPITGYLSISVTAENKDEAIKKAFNQASLEHLHEWDTHKSITQGNVCRAVKHELEVIEES